MHQFFLYDFLKVFCDSFLFRPEVGSGSKYYGSGKNYLDTGRIESTKLNQLSRYIYEYIWRLWSALLRNKNIYICNNVFILLGFLQHSRYFRHSGGRVHSQARARGKNKYIWYGICLECYQILCIPLLKCCCFLDKTIDKPTDIFLRLYFTTC